LVVIRDGPSRARNEVAGGEKTARAGEVPAS
jgi:hypothetical protein